MSGWWSESDSSRQSRQFSSHDSHSERLSPLEASTSGRLFEASGSRATGRGHGSLSQSSRLGSRGNRELERHKWTGWEGQQDRQNSGHFTSFKAAQGRIQPWPESTFRSSLAGQGRDQNAPLDLRRESSQAEALLGRLKQSAGGHELSQGLTSLLNSPTSSSSTGQSGTLGAVWCWPFGGGGPDLSQAVPPADPTLLPAVSLSEFQPYLDACAARQAWFEAVRKPQAPGTPSSSATEAQDTSDREHGSAHIPGEGLVEAMRTVPAMFFSEDFSLARPETWQEVLSTEDEGQRLAKEEEYLRYSDIVEVQLGREIGARFENFFEAAGILQDLRSYLHRTYSHVTSLRRLVRGLQSEVGQAAEDVACFKRKKANLQAVMDKLKVIEEVASAQETVELLLPQGDFAGAMDVLDSLRTTLSTHHTAGLHAFRHLPAQIADIAEAIDTLLSTEFLRVTQFHEQAAVVASIATMQSADTRPLTDTQMDEDAAGAVDARSNLEDELMPLILGLNRTGHLCSTLRDMRVAAAEEVKTGIREVVEQGFAHFSGNAAASGISERLQALRPAEFIQILGCVSRVSVASLAHVRQVQAVVEELLKTTKAGRQLIAAATPEFAEVLQSVSEAAHSRWIKLLAARSSTVPLLNLKELRELLDVSESFAKGMQAVGSRPVLALRNALQVQSKAYLDSMHPIALARLASNLEQELWSAANVPAECQAIVDNILSRSAATQYDTTAEQQESSSSSTKGNQNAPEAGKLRVADQAFSVVDSELLLLQLLDQYLHFLDAVPSLAAEVARRVVELIKVFNSRMCQLVLGAGALQVAGLKSITAKHLALSCQCIGALIALHPALVATLGAHLPVSRRALLVPELGLVLQDLVLHRGEVHGKLVGIMRERLIFSLRQLPALAAKWEGLSPGTEPVPSLFSHNLVKQLRTLSQVLQPWMLEEELHAVFGRVAALYSKNLAEAFSRLEPLGGSWETQVRIELGFLLEALQDLPMAPAAKTSSLKHLNQLCRTRFAPLADVEARGKPPKPAPAAGESTSPAPDPRPTLVSRLGTGKLPFFRRDKGPSSVDEPGAVLPDSNGSAAQNGHRNLEDVSNPASNQANVSARNILQEDRGDAEGLHAALALQEASGERQTAESVVDLAEQLPSSQALSSSSRVQSFGDADQPFALSSVANNSQGGAAEQQTGADVQLLKRELALQPDIALTPAQARSAAEHCMEVSASSLAIETMGATGDPEQLSVPEMSVQSLAAGLIVAPEAACERVAEAAEALLDTEASALDPGLDSLQKDKVAWLDNTGKAGDGHEGSWMAEDRRSDGAMDMDGSSISSDSQKVGSDLAKNSPGPESSSPKVLKDCEINSPEQPRKNAAMAIEEMLKSMQREDWEKAPSSEMNEV